MRTWRNDPRTSAGSRDCREAVRLMTRTPASAPGPLGRWVLACRPRTLTAAAAPVVAGTGLAVFTGPEVRWSIALLALLAAGAIQIATNLFNDALDFQKGADTGARLGPVRVTQSGLIPASRVLAGGGVASLVALACGIPLVITGGWPIVVIGLASLALAYGYTGGPYPLAYHGLGEVFVLVFFGLVAVGGVYYLHTDLWNVDALVAGLEMGCLATALLAVNNLRDVESDRKSGKRTLAVRLGVGFGRLEILVMCLLPFGLNGWWLPRSLVAALLPWLVLPLAVAVVRAVLATEPGAAYNRILARTALLELAFAVLLALGMMV
jgi:1,4-dihydroxy-2-naphthoate polyprenyltransferase